MRTARVIAVGSIVLLTSCAEQGRSPMEIETISTDPPHQMNCDFAPCTDPSPQAPGVHLGAGITPAYCFAAASDIDHDGFDDNCERLLAQNFRPEMASAPSDDTRGEVYFIVQPVGSNIRVTYLLGYYWDLGDPHAWCETPFTPECGGHHGDSEWVSLDVEYCAPRWCLDQAILSAHWQTDNDETDIVSFGEMEYPANWRGYPRVYVALKKHSNYYSKERCNGFWTFDVCADAPVYQRVEYVPHRNIGSRTHNAISDGYPKNRPGTCRGSEELFQGSGILECFWLAPSGYHFNGWQEANDPVNPYLPQLSYLGF